MDEKEAEARPVMGTIFLVFLTIVFPGTHNVKYLPIFHAKLFQQSSYFNRHAHSP